MAIGLGPGKGKKKEASKPLKVYSKGGQMVAAPGYKLGLIRNTEHTKNPTKKITMGTGPAAVTRVQQQGIIGPVKAGPGKPVAAAPAKKKGPSAVGKAISKAKTSIEMASRRRFATSAYRGGGGGGRRGGGKTCAAYR
jgi:hypothetical protein